MNRRYEVLYEPSASKRLKKLRQNRVRIEDAINALAAAPRAHGSEKIAVHTHRIRVGDWRVVYVVQDSPHYVVLISKIANRNERTYKNI